MDVTYQTDTEQTALWNGLAGRAWVEAQELLDHVFRPLEDLIDVSCVLPEEELVGYFTRFGPLGRILHEVDEQTRTQVIETVRPAFDPYVLGAEVHFNAACWMTRRPWST
jgi:hypothetical protein